MWEAMLTKKEGSIALEDTMREAMLTQKEGVCCVAEGHNVGRLC
jgi:hypothetical protein